MFCGGYGNHVGIVSVGGEGGSYLSNKLDGRQPPRGMVEPSRPAWNQQASPQQNIHSECLLIFFFYYCHYFNSDIYECYAYFCLFAYSIYFIMRAIYMGIYLFYIACNLYGVCV